MTRTTSHTDAELTVVGIDIGKDVFHLVGFDTNGKIAFRRKIRRLALEETFKTLPSCIVGMEACLSAHFVARTLRRLEQLARDARDAPLITVDEVGWARG
ncbi:hypothetical protein AE618_10800 [Bosea vaviloviae]|uniref:Transposase n=1 Tax=Bosea vaviloviae TaxID=1526658 RepID=A0A0N0MCF7_9HYPH|nr:hypothetical protein AE618_10800 [Bosea vaviloviae]